VAAYLFHRVLGAPVVSVTRDLSAPRELTQAWGCLLLAPVSWSAALGILFSLTNEVCARGGRGAMFAVASACILLSIAPAPLAWLRRRSISGASAAGERARFLMAVAVGASAIFTLVLVVTAIPTLLLSACRT
jgi:hypothetical protein